MESTSRIHKGRIFPNLRQDANPDLNKGKMDNPSYTDAKESPNATFGTQSGMTPEVIQPPQRFHDVGTPARWNDNAGDEGLVLY